MKGIARMKATIRAAAESRLCMAGSLQSEQCADDDHDEKGDSAAKNVLDQAVALLFVGWASGDGVAHGRFL